MSLTFGADTADRVEEANHANTQNLAARSILMWIYPTTLTLNRGLWSKRANAGSLHRFALQPASDELKFFINHTGGSPASCTVETNNADLTTNKWWFVVATYDGAASPQGRIYRGDLGALATECTYGLQISSNLTTPDADDTHPIIWAQRQGGASDLVSAFQGRIAVVAYFNRALSLGEIRSWQFAPRNMPGCVSLKRFGDNGTGTQPDYANGESGTVTGATQSDNPPLRRWRRARSLYVPYETVVAPPSESYFFRRRVG